MTVDGGGQDKGVTHKVSLFDQLDFTELPTAVRVEPMKGMDVAMWKERSASLIATIVVTGFIVLIALAFVFLLVVVTYDPTAEAAAVTQTEGLIQTVAAVMSGIVGAIVGYYYRSVVEYHGEDKYD